MSSTHTRIHHLPLAVIVAVIINALLFAGLPMLTRVQERKQSKPYEDPIMLMAHKPPKPPDPEKKEKKLKDRKLKKTPKKRSSARRKNVSKPDMDLPRFEFATDAGGLAGGIGIVSPSRIEKIKEIKQLTAKIGFELSEVDTPPRILRKFNPIYPFGAKRQGITGKVMIRCLIKKDGKADKFKVLKSEPKGVFDESAVNAITRWRFKPGILGGEAVPTWVRIPIIFELD